MRRSNRRDFNVNIAILTGTAAYADAVPARTGYTTWITKIVLSITTHVADTYLVDDDGTGAVITQHLDVTPQAAGVPSSVVWDFGEGGTPVTAAANVDVSHSSTGVGRMHIEGYYKKV